jgi:YD repeat-containing protein
VTQAPDSVADAALTTYSYDIVGNLKDVLAPNQQAGGPQAGTKTTYFYDERNRLSDLDDPIPANRNSRMHTVSLIFSEGGNKIQQIRANNELSQWHYDTMNRVDLTTGFGGETTGYGYDLAGNVLTVTDANQHIYKYTYDLLNRRITSTYPKDAANSARGEIWRYNSANDLDRYTNTAAQVKTLTYDNRHRLTNSSWSTSSAPAVRADYYGNSQPHNVWTLDPAGTPITTVTFQYDGANNLISENQTLAGQSTHYVVPGWDADGNRNNLAVTTNGITDINFHYEYTKRNQLSLISANGGSFPLEGYYYDPNGNMTRRQGRWFWAGTNYFYDALNRVTKCEQTGKDGSSAPYARSQQIYDSVSR